jgi:hypothetical protein
MARLFATVLAAAAAAYASSISEYYNPTCGPPVNTEIDGSTPTFCNTQQGASIGYTLDAACTLNIYDGNTCSGDPVQSVPSSPTGCIDFPGTGGSWLFAC